MPRYCKLGAGCAWCKGERQMTVGVSVGVRVRRWQFCSVVEKTSEIGGFVVVLVVCYIYLDH